MKFPKSNNFELELTSKCTIKCPKCPRTFQQDTRHLWDNGHIDHNSLIKFLRTTNAKLFNLTGAYGDALYHPHLVDTIKAIKEMGGIVQFNTNGSYRKQEDWEEIGKSLDKGDLVEFSIDGTPDNFTEYRVNGDWESIEIGIKTLAKYSAILRWKYIIFKYNQSYEDMKTAYDCADRLGINQFVLIHTHRAIPSQLANKEEFLSNLDTLEEYVYSLDTKNTYLMIGVTPRTNQLKTKSIVKSKSKHLRQKKVMNTMQTEHVFPQCMNIENYINFISSDGLFLPCCFMRVEQQESFDEAGLTDKDVKGLSIENNTLNDIIKGTAFKKFMENFDNMQICRKHCNKNKA
tara:strand:- start:1038 stop:2075 length:1038 start_codon:yes stop_codon:yes gene_type:complete